MPFSARNASPLLAVTACSCGISVRRPQAQGVLLCKQQAKTLKVKPPLTYALLVCEKCLLSVSCIWDHFC